MLLQKNYEPIKNYYVLKRRHDIFYTAEGLSVLKNELIL